MNTKPEARTDIEAQLQQVARALLEKADKETISTDSLKALAVWVLDIADQAVNPR